MISAKADIKKLDVVRLERFAFDWSQRLIIRMFDSCSTCIYAVSMLRLDLTIVRPPKIASCLRVPESQTPAYTLMIVNRCFCLCRR